MSISSTVEIKPRLFPAPQKTKLWFTPIIIDKMFQEGKAAFLLQYWVSSNSTGTMSYLIEWDKEGTEMF